MVTPSALCETDSRLLAVNGEGFVQLLEQNPEMGFTVTRRIAEVISSRLRNTRLALLKTL